jgi:hypothetical protein
MNLKLVLMIIAILVLFKLFFTGKKEFYSSPLEQKIQALAESINNYITEFTTYPEYLDFLTNHDNTSYKILEQETFYTLKSLKKLDKLTVEDIKPYLSDSV